LSKPPLVKGLVALLRLPYWLMTGGLSLLTALAITKGDFSNVQLLTGSTNIVEISLLIFFSMACITSAGFAINDFFDKESDAVIKPKRPLPAGALSLKQVVGVSTALFVVGLVLAAFINWLSFAILAVDSAVLVAYSGLVKRKSGFVANILVGLLTGTAFMYGEATITNPSVITLVSLCLYPIAFWNHRRKRSARHPKLRRRLKSRVSDVAPKNR
jgi:4-hydroxybenzoate polyprenyltransferase